jgi:UDP-GlcNAc:undecaprenyl-phosphate GlcNAc-1-phosphate transferase
MINIFLIIFASVNLIIYFKLNKIANLINIYDKPDAIRKFHLKKTPLLGGIIFFFNFLIFLTFLNIYYSNNFYYFLYLEDLPQFYLWIIIITILFIISIYDDYIEIENFKKLIFISVLIYFYVNFDQIIQIKQFRFFNKEYNFSINNLSLIFTSLCILSLIIALNMYDGVNTNSIGYFLFVFLYITLKVENNIFFIFIIFILFFLLLLNFLGKLFLGDSGVNLFSFILGFVIIKLYNLKIINYIEEIALMTFFPTVDMARVFIFRLFSKKSPFQPDRKHLHHLIKDNYEKSYFYILLFINSFPFFLLIIFPSYLYISLLICLALYFFLLAKTKFINVRKF